MLPTATEGSVRAAGGADGRGASGAGGTSTAVVGVLPPLRATCDVSQAHVVGVQPPLCATCDTSQAHVVGVQPPLCTTCDAADAAGNGFEQAPTSGLLG